MERVYFDEPTSEMLYAKDVGSITCHSKGFGFDELGMLHLLYYNKDNKVIRDFVIPPDPEPGTTPQTVIDSMEARRSKESQSRKTKLGLVGLAFVCIMSITFSVMYMLIH